MHAITIKNSSKQITLFNKGIISGFAILVIVLRSLGASADDAAMTLDTVDVVGSPIDLIGIADTASEGTVTEQQLASRPVYRDGELLEAVPGLVVTQHSGEGKANQYYLRGFNLDHGTDIAITLDDMPVNMPSHAHGQGYSDLNFMIPDLLSDINYQKGPYFADQGDFATAGAVQINYLNKLDKDVAEAGVGSFGYGRTFSAISRPLGTGNLLAGAEYEHLDGPWQNPDDYNKGNAVLRYTDGTDNNGWGASFMAYVGQWNATNQIPQRAVDDGQLSYWGSEDPTDGGNAQRFSLSGHYVQTDGNIKIKASAYLIDSELDLYNNFTFYLYNPVQGDQFHQHDARVIGGGQASYTVASKIAGFDTENIVGTEIRADDINLGLYQTDHREYLSTDRVDRVIEQSTGVYEENHTQWLQKLRTVFGLREDLFYGADQSDNPLNGGVVTAFRVSPKGSLIVGPWSKTEIYLSAGEGFHSNDLRSATNTVEPTTYNNNVSGISGAPVQKFPLLEPALGEEIGIRSSIVPNLQSSLAFFQLQLASEQVFDGDAGDSSPSGKSTRQGFEFANSYTPIPGISVNADISASRARFDEPVSDGITTGTYIAGSPNVVASSGITFDNFGSWFGALQYTMYGPRPLTDDDSVRSPATDLVNMRVGYKLTEAISAMFDVTNLLNSKEQDVSYYYASRLQNEPLGLVGTGVNDVHFHAAEPLGFRLSLVARF